MSLGYEHPIVFCRIGKNNVYGGNDMPGLIEEPVLTKKELRKRKKELKKQKKMRHVKVSKLRRRKNKHNMKVLTLVNVPERNLCMFHSIRRNVKIF